uniref:MADF domain-containing protein n=1 Tax=Bombyx mori TaxID=7091 RepID=A0A8R2DK87_BOMMO|nr:uncharacterized protein LOC110384835 [Bombyx mori]
MTIAEVNSKSQVSLYKNHNILWDPKRSSHYNKSEREAAWRDIAAASSIEVEDFKKKNTSLLGSFRREKSRTRKSLLAGTGPEDVYKSKWFAFDTFEFFNERNLPQTAADSMLEAFQAQEGSTSNSETSSHIKPTKKIKRKLNNNHSASEALAQIRTQPESSSADHYASFGNYVANELRKYDKITLA